jgi:hypothetical protein
MESNLSRRIGLLENEFAEQSRKVQEISANPDATEERFEKLLSAMETFWAQAPRQFPQLSAPEALPVPAAPPAPVAASAPAESAATEAPAQAPAPGLPPAAQQSRGWSILGLAMASAMAILLGLAFPSLQRQWARFASVETLPIVKPKPPAAPVLPLDSAHPKPAAKMVSARSPEPFTGPLIPLDIPAKVKPKIQSEVRVGVVVAIDQEGKVTGARVTSTEGDSANLLVTEALRAARESHFRQALEGRKPVESQMVLTFLFKPDSSEF